MLHVGLDLSRKRVDVCAISDEGELIHRFAAPADRDGLYGLDRRLAVYGEPVRGVVESMNGARFVHDELTFHGWEVLVADAQKVKGLAPLACKTDKSAWAAAHPGGMKCFSVPRRARSPFRSWRQLNPYPSLAQGRGTWHCRYEHELQIRFSPRSLPGGAISVIVRKEPHPTGHFTPARRDPPGPVVGRRRVDAGHDPVGRARAVARSGPLPGRHPS